MGYIQYVNIKQGSDSVNRFSNGNTLPLVQQPFGFAAFVPQGDASRGRCVTQLAYQHLHIPFDGQSQFEI